MSNDIHFKVGVRLKDHLPRSRRIIELKNVINPMGTNIGPWWEVENIKTKRRSVIRENRLRSSRWEEVKEEATNGE